MLHNTSYAMTGLTPSTDYDVYVQAVCSPTDVSYWVGPLTISTTFVQPGCGDNFGPYCYGANAYTVFTATATPGDFITVDITAGETEVGYDNLEFYDGVGNTETYYIVPTAIIQVFLFFQHQELLLNVY